MTSYEIILELCKGKGIAPTALEKELGFSRGSIGKLKKGGTSAGRLQKIADYFGVSVEYLMTGEATPTMALSDEEQGLIWAFRKLNEEGKSMLLAQLRMISREDIYKKDTASTSRAM